MTDIPEERSDMKPAILACVVMLPILFGIGWLSDIITRDTVGMMILSHGDDPSIVMKQPTLSKMWPSLLLMWVIASGIVLLLAKAGLGSTVRCPPPPPIHPKPPTP